MYIHRIMETKLKYLSEHFPVVMVCGARQVGKTTLLHRIKEENEQIQYVTLDYPKLRMLAREDPELFLQQYKAPLIIEEIQYAPELLPEDYFGGYMQTYLERDIRDLIAVRDEGRFLKFISCVAARTGQEVNLADIGKDVEIDRKTAEGWLSILVSSGLVYLLRPYSGNTIKRIVKRPKLYFMDTGLACYLSYWNNPRALELSAMSGAMFENYVMSEIIKGYANWGIDARSRFCYYRDNNGREIDLMILENGKLYPVEIKKSADPGKSALKNFCVLDSLPEEIGEGAVICMTPMVVPLDEKNKLMPVACI